MKFLVVGSILLLGAGSIASEEVAEEEGDDVLVLTKDNFQEAIESNEFILVKFYAPWCGHCKSLAPEYSEAAAILAEEESPIKLAKVDATVETSIAEKFEVSGYPTLKFFVNGEPMEYGGGRTADTIVSWVEKKTGPPAKAVNSVEEAKAFTEGKSVSIIGFFKDGTTAAAQAFYAAASSIDDLDFAITGEQAVFTEYDIEGEAVLLLKDFDAGKAVLTQGLTEEAIIEFIDAESVPYPAKILTSLEEAKTFTTDKSIAVIGFFKDETTEAGKAFLESARRLENYEFAITADDAVFAEYEVSGEAVVVLTGTPAGKFVLSEEINEDSIRKFVRGQVVLEDEVLVLTDENVQEAIESNEHILVEFYAPWCGHCKTLAPEYAKAAKALAEKKSSIKLAKVDATQETVAAGTYEVRGYPTIKFFVNGKPMDYKGGRTGELIVSWLEKRTGPPAKTLASLEEVKAYTEGKSVSIIGFFKDETTDAAKAYLAVASAVDDHAFAITKDEAVFAEYGIKDDAVLLLKDFDDGKAVLSEGITEEEIKRFIQSESLPLVIEWTRDIGTKIFVGEVKHHLLVFTSFKAENHKETVAMLTEVAKANKGKMYLVTINTDVEEFKRLIDFFSIEDKELPTFRAAQMGESVSKFKPDNKALEADNLKAFVDGFLEGKLKQYLKSEDVPEDWDKQPVKVLVGKNFDQVALNKEKDVFVEFYAPWCGHCQKLAPIWDQLGEKYKDHESIVIAKIDSTANELENVKVQGYPTIKLFKKGTNEVVDFKGSRTQEGFVTFLEGGEENDKPGKKDEL